MSDAPNAPIQPPGSCPDPGDPIEAARRFWCGRELVSVDEFTAPKGTVAITLDVHGADPSTCTISAAKLAPMLVDIEALAKGQSYHALVRLTAREFVRAKREHDETVLSWVGLLALYTAFNHPRMPQMRTAVSAKMRHDEVPHISWNFGPGGLSIALGEKFIDFGPLAGIASRNSGSAHAADQHDDVQT